jgi:RNA polymerase sigma-70 factor (ECF subfamily)
VEERSQSAFSVRLDLSAVQGAGVAGKAMSERTTRTAATAGGEMHEVIEHLLRGKARLIKSLETRLGNRADAEDVLQQALLILVAKGQSLRRGQSVVAWFHTVLRNLLVDAHRRRMARAKLAARLEAESLVLGERDDALFAEICACVLEVMKTLRPGYAKILRLVELDGRPVAQVAGRLGITGANTYVRLHRARRALLEGLRRVCGVCLEHGCFDCTCRTSRGAGDKSDA